MKNINNIKASAKTTVSVPQDFHSFLFQIKAFTLACQFIFGEESILTIQLQNFAAKIAKHNIVYKNQIARDDNFAGKFFGQWTNRSNFSSKTVANARTAKTWVRG